MGRSQPRGFVGLLVITGHVAHQKKGRLGGEVSRALAIQVLQQVVGGLLDLTVVVLGRPLLGVDERRAVDLGEVAVREGEPTFRAFRSIGVDA